MLNTVEAIICLWEYRSKSTPTRVQTLVVHWTLLAHYTFNSLVVFSTTAVIVTHDNALHVTMAPEKMAASINVLAVLYGDNSAWIAYSAAIGS